MLGVQYNSRRSDLFGTDNIVRFMRSPCYVKEVETNRELVWGPEANGKSAALDVIVAFIIWLNSACRIGRRGAENQVKVHFLTAEKAFDHLC